MIRPSQSNSALKRKRRRRRRNLRILLLLGIAVGVVVLLVLIALFLLRQPGKRPAADSSAATTTTSATTTTTTTTATSAPTSTGSPSSGSSDNVAEDPCFDNVAFIGDSRTEGLQLYIGVPNATFYASKGLMVNTFFTKEFVKQGDKKVTIPVDMQSKTFKKVYIMLGVNELGWAYESVFIQDYGKLVDEVKRLQPGATIYVQAILPVTKTKSDADKIYNNPKINRYNELIQQMCTEKQVTYLDVSEGLDLDNGALPEGSASDGIHLNREYCFKWLRYLRDHTS